MTNLELSVLFPNVSLQIHQGRRGSIVVRHASRHPSFALILTALGESGNILRLVPHIVLVVFGVIELNILQIISGRGVNGALVYCKLLSNILAERGHNVSLLCRPSSWMNSGDYHSSVEVAESAMRRFPTKDLRDAAARIREQQIDVIHTHMTRAHSFGAILRLMTGVPLIATAHHRQLHLHWSFNDFIISNSEATRDYHQRVNLISDEKIKTVYAFTDLDRFDSVTNDSAAAVRRLHRIDKSDFLIGVFGEVAERKGHNVLFQALPNVVQRIPNAKLLVVGRFGRRQPHYKKLRHQLLQSGMARRTKWVGRRSNIGDYMAACDLTVIPSIEEPLGLVAIESMKLGTPVIASRTGGLMEIVHHGKNGLLFPVGDSVKLASAIIELANDLPLRDRIAISGKATISERFCPRKLVSEIESVYHSVASNSRAA